MSSRNQCSTRFSQELEVGVKCRCERFWRGFATQGCDLRRLVGGEVVEHDVHLECARRGLIDLLNGLS